MRLVDFLDQSSALFGPVSKGAKFFDLDNQTSFSFQEMFNASIHLAEFLVERGVEPEDVVATYAPNSVAAYCCIFAISRVGAIWLPLNIRNTASSNLKLIGLSDAKFLFIDEVISAKYPKLLDSFSSGKVACLGPEKIANFDFSSLKKSTKKIILDEVYVNKQDLNEVRSQDLSADKIISLFPTGGTTGDPKLAEWGSSTWEAIVDIQQQQMPIIDVPSCYLVAAAMTHAAGVGSFTTILQGGSIFVMDGFEPDKILGAIERHQITSLFLPPTAIYMLLASSKIRSYDYSSLRYFWYAAAPMSVEKLKEAISVFGSVMVQTYGQAEAPMICTFLSAEDHAEALAVENTSILGSCGKASPGIKLSIFDKQGHQLSPGLKGEVAVKGSLLMKGYHKNPKANKAIRLNEWQLTGDIGTLDEDGFLSLTDRKGDMIISGGFNVYPGEIEQLIWGMPTIKDCAVIGLPHEKWGEQVTAIVELKDASIVPDEDEIIQLCKKKLGSVKAPKKIIILGELPRSPVGKVLKKDLRAIFGMKKNDRFN